MPDEQLPGDQVARIHAERSYEVALDDEPETGPAVYVDVTSPAGERRPIIPPGLWGLVKKRAGLHLYQAAWHGARLPLYLLLALFWSAVGLVPEREVDQPIITHRITQRVQLAENGPFLRFEVDFVAVDEDVRERAEGSGHGVILSSRY